MTGNIQLETAAVYMFNMHDEMRLHDSDGTSIHWVLHGDGPMYRYDYRYVIDVTFIAPFTDDRYR